MSESKQGWGRTVLGWFVETDESAPEQAEPAAPAEPVPEPAAAVEPVGELPASVAGSVDFDGVFAAYGIAGEAREQLAKAAGLLASLPAGTDPAVQRQIVEASLTAFGVPFAQIIETACEEIQALDAYQRQGASTLKQGCDAATGRIAALEQEIASLRAAMAKDVEDQKRMIETCNRKKLEVQRVLEFFGADAVGRVVRDSPKLIDPGGQGGPATPAH